jgi:hypothetical protein
MHPHETHSPSNRSDFAAIKANVVAVSYYGNPIVGLGDDKLRFSLNFICQLEPVVRKFNMFDLGIITVLICDPQLVGDDRTA